MTATVKIDGNASGAVAALDGTAKAAQDAERDLTGAGDAAKGAARDLDGLDRAAEDTTRSQRRMRQQVEESADAMEELARETGDADKAAKDLGGTAGSLSGVLGGGRGSLLASAGLAGAAIGGATLAIGALRGAMDAVWESTERFFQSQGREDLWESAERSARRYSGTLITLVTGTTDADEAHARLMAGLDAGYVLMDRFAGTVRPLASLLGGALVTALNAAGAAAQILTGDFDELESQMRDIETQAARSAAATRTLATAIEESLSSTLVGRIQQMRSEMEGIDRAVALQYATERARELRIGAEDMERYISTVTDMVLSADVHTERLRVRTESGFTTLRVAGDELLTLNELLDRQRRDGVSLLDARIEREETLLELERQRDARRSSAAETPPAPLTPSPGRGARSETQPAGISDALRESSEQLAAMLAASAAAMAEQQAKRERMSMAAQISKAAELEAAAAAAAELERIEADSAARRLAIVEQTAEATGAAFDRAARAAALSMGAGVEESADRSRRVLGGLAADMLDMLARTTLAVAGVTGLFDVVSGGLPNPGKAIAMVAAAGTLRAASAFVRGVSGAGGSSGAGVTAPVQSAAAAAPMASSVNSSSVSYNVVNQFGVVGDLRAVAGVVANSVRYAQREGML